jgi:hypothetical protein
MSNEIKEATKERKNWVARKSFPEMPKWQREMERMFGKCSEEENSTAEINDIDEKKTP